MNLAALRQVAEAATPGPWTAKDAFDGFDVPYNGDEVCNLCACVVAPPKTAKLSHPRKDALYIATMNPQVALALIAVAEAAQEHADSLAEYPEQLVPINRDGGTARALRAALAVLEGME